uniref:Putative plant transposon protein domain-containing protein n=2 Tax=Cajanus cajan TaxID=3821 RepID=A0A151S0V7_CAJCA|nr:hypothetical protein KK1_029905 [Cajanus cajan]
MCMPGTSFHRNRAQQPLHVKRRDLLPVARIWSALIHANILPCSHVSDLHWSRAMLMHCIMTGRTVDIGFIICVEISNCANASPSAALGHPSLITQLCQLAGVDVHAPPFEGPGRAIDNRYISTYCQDRLPPAVVPEPIHVAGPQEDMPMDDAPAPDPPLTFHQRFDALEGRLDTLMLQQESLHRGQLFLLDVFRSFALHSATAPSYQFPSVADYHAYTGWLGDQDPFFRGGGAAANDVDGVDEGGADPGNDDEQAP